MDEPIRVRTADGHIESWSAQRWFAEGTWHVELADPRGRLWKGAGPDVFDVFTDLRQEPEAEGRTFLVVGARLDCWPTGMSSQMSGGNLLALRDARWRMLLRNLLSFFPSLGDRVLYRDIFAPAPARKVGTTAAQSTYRSHWTTTHY
ncbi:hypothetical protein [Actinocorallia sp. A-T 12471]|uniref:hypothetical protein n=1 Tax=Actinocorallia sp. A-T 12471 TaxID=3089813 RepID=UPI0029CADBA7|nr:hypothetical protein [Actinocorallia sp. A-T 12471]MDX6739372.1 hypothetical protein [Actinocorallia sp. A-T 12471]